MPTPLREAPRGALALVALLVLAACGAPAQPNPDPDPDPASPSITVLGTGFASVPAGVTFTAPFAVAPPPGGSAADVACTLTLDGAPLLEVAAPCSEGEVALGPFDAGATPTLSLRASTAQGGEASASWSVGAAAWAPFQRLEGVGAVRALAGSDARLAVLRDTEEGALRVFERPLAPRQPGVWAPGPVALEATLPRGRGAAIAWHRDELAWLSDVVDGYVALDRFAPDGADWNQTRVGGFVWPGAFVEPRLAISARVSVVGDGAAGDGGRWWARHDQVDGFFGETSDFGGGFPAATPGDRAGAAVAALDDAFLVGAPGAIRYEGDDFGGALRPNGRVLVAAPDRFSVSQVSGGFGSGPSAEIGQHLAVVWTPTPVAFMVGARDAVWGRIVYVPPEEDDDGGDYDLFEVIGELELSDPDATLPWGARWLAVNVPPTDRSGPEGVLASALVAIGRDDGTVHLYVVPLVAGIAPIALGTLDAAGATGPGAWVGGALALPYGDDVVLFDLSAPPVAP